MLCPRRQGCPRAPRPLRRGQGYPRVQAGAHLRPPSWVPVSEGKCSLLVSWAMIPHQRRGPSKGAEEVGAPGTTCLATWHVSDGKQHGCPVLCASERGQAPHGPTSTSEKHWDWGWQGTRTDWRQDTADQRQGEVREPGPNPPSAISELWDFGKVSPSLILHL